VYRDVEHIETITKQDMIDFFNTHIDPASKTRAKISTHLLAQAKSEDTESTKSSSTKTTEEPQGVKDETASATNSELRVEEQKKEVGTAIRIEDVRSFKASMPLSEAMRPVKDLAEFEDKGAKL
jgi:insulysin